MTRRELLRKLGLRLLALVVLHELGRHLMAEYRVMEVILAPGAGGAWLPGLLAAAFLVVRLVLVLILPGVVLAGLGALPFLPSRPAAAAAPAATPPSPSSDTDE